MNLFGIFFICQKKKDLIVSQACSMASMSIAFHEASHPQSCFSWKTARMMPQILPTRFLEECHWQRLETQLMNNWLEYKVGIVKLAVIKIIKNDIQIAGPNGQVKPSSILEGCYSVEGCEWEMGGGNQGGFGSAILLRGELWYPGNVTPLWTFCHCMFFF